MGVKTLVKNKLRNREVSPLLIGHNSTLAKAQQARQTVARSTKGKPLLNGKLAFELKTIFPARPIPASVKTAVWVRETRREVISIKPKIYRKRIVNSPTRIQSVRFGELIDKSFLGTLTLEEAVEKKHLAELMDTRTGRLLRPALAHIGVKPIE